MILFFVYALALFHGLIIMPIIIVVPVLLAVSQKKLRWLENIFIIVGSGAVLSFVLTGSCFLTDWEQALRTMIAPEFSYSGGFVVFYLSKVGINFSEIGTAVVVILTVLLGTVAIIKKRLTGKPLIGIRKV